ncbi:MULTISPECIES: fimbrial protein [unclassified Caballeronia]|uniref:fimbrial protein n=1 Tax=unclassified Caballeronia TaxID=2646786 RepID=UPI0028594C90|nr:MULTISPECIES: fimbrial protein [unclassified Caballeronia]MDR5818165.1 fimbrial protein [Caballeronia sp. LZ033]MDR5825131.1 fimbrial protein [Caballeronia sp. LZ043]
MKDVGMARVRSNCLAGLLAIMLPMLHAEAGTLTYPSHGIQVLNVPASLSVGRDIPVGTTLWQQMNNAGVATNDVTCLVQKDVTVTGTLVPGYTNIYQSGVQGIGVRFYVTSNFLGQLVAVPVSQSFTSPPNSSMEYDVRADYIVTGPIKSGTTLNLPSMQITFSGSCFNTVTATQTLTGNTAVTGNTCSVTTPTLTFQLPRAFSKDLASAGATTGDTVVPLDLNCPAGVKVGITITDAVNPANRSSTLSLAANSSAAGVGVQILNGTTAVSFGPDSAAAGTVNQWIAGTSAGGAMRIPLTARYVRTSSTLVPGSVNGKATFTMSYQ